MFIILCSFTHPPSFLILFQLLWFLFHLRSLCSVFTKLFRFSSPSLSALLLLSLSSIKHRESVLWLRPQLLPAPLGWQCQQWPGTRLHQKHLRAFHLFTMWLCSPPFLFLFLNRGSASFFPKPSPFSHAIICQLSSSHPTDQSQLRDEMGQSASSSTPSTPQPTSHWGYPSSQ